MAEHLGIDAATEQHLLWIAGAPPPPFRPPLHRAASERRAQLQASTRHCLRRGVSTAMLKGKCEPNKRRIEPPLQRRIEPPLQ